MRLRLIPSHETQVSVVAPSQQSVAIRPSQSLVEAQNPSLAQNEAEVDRQLRSLGRDFPLREQFLIAEYVLVYPALCIAAWLATDTQAYPITFLCLGTLATLHALNRGVDNKLINREAQPFLATAPSYLSVFMNGIGDPNPRIEQIAIAVLDKTIREVSRSDFDSVPAHVKTVLYQWLAAGSSRHTSTRALIIDAMAQIGDEAAIPYLETIARKIPITLKQWKLRTAARAALPILHDRLEREKKTFSHDGSVEQQSEEAEKEQMSPEAEALLAQFLQDSKDRVQPCMRMGYLIANFCVVTPGAVVEAIINITNHAPWGISATWIALAAVSTQLYRLVLSPSDFSRARQLAQSGNVDAVGPLAEFLEWPDANIRNEAWAALCGLLPKLKASDAGLLNDRQRAALNAQLKFSNAQSIAGSRLQIEILKALQQVGDSSSLPYVERLATSRPIMKTERDVVEAANECLPALHERKHQNDSIRMLLRPSSAFDIEPESLLRPSTSQDTSPEELVRPSDPGT